MSTRYVGLQFTNILKEFYRNSFFKRFSYDVRETGKEQKNFKMQNSLF